jgi:cellulose synthase/poly-beta-1,6-N-acetylglucosamine synthase-like glycosyltransferase
MIVRKDVFEAIGKFNEKLYPNEENDFINRAINSGLKIIYDPEIYVFRSQRAGLRTFILQMFTYGRGRAEQTKVNPGSFRAALLAPVFFTFYSALYPVLFVFFREIFSSAIISVVLILPFILYFTAIAVSAVMLIKRRGYFSALYPLFFIICHLCYGAGFIYGIFRRKFRSEGIEIICSVRNHG